MTGVGKVILVGAGPGNIGLLTLRGKEALEKADLVLYDRLVGRDILALIPAAAIRVDVGKSAGRHPVPQHEINEMLLRFAREGKCVVRLKGGDPYLFGRGAEELAMILKENIPFEVVPGVTSAIAAPSFAGIPVSHRDFSSSVHIITAHRKDNGSSEIDYESLVKLGGTLVFLMGLGTIGAVTAGLIHAGMTASTPAALIENGTRPNQRKLVATVADIGPRSKRRDFASPSVLIVGGVCSLAEKFDWFSRLPLHGVHTVVTRPKAEETLSRKLRELGANVLRFPCIHTRPLPVPNQVFDSLTRYGWMVFTSPTGAELFFKSLRTRDVDIRSLYGVRFAAVGAKTASVVAERGIRVDYVPEIYNARELASGLPAAGGPPTRVLLFRGSEGAPELAATLRARGFEVDDVAAYQTVRENTGSEAVRELLEGGEAVFVTFTSVSTVQGFFTGSLSGVDCAKTAAVCIGEETGLEARKHGFRVLISEEATIESLIERIREECRQ